MAELTEREQKLQAVEAAAKASDDLLREQLEEAQRTMTRDKEENAQKVGTGMLSL